MILIPKHKELVLPVHLQSRVAGFYTIETMGADGRRRVRARFPNLITTNGGNLLGNNSNPFNVCVVGSGNTPPALTDTQLQTLVGSTTTRNSTGSGNSGSAPYFGSTTIQYSFAPGVATGNLSEVGVGATNTSLFSRALILDGGGSPTTITVLSSETLYVTYQLNQYVPTADVTGSVVIAGVTYNYTVRGANATGPSWSIANNGDSNTLGLVQTYNGSIQAVTSSPSGVTGGLQSSSVNNAYSTGSFTNSGTATWAIGNGNISGGISALLLICGSSNNSRGSYQIGMAPAIPKTSSLVLTLTFSNSWAINSP